ncbi:MAG: DUF1345 domain-containing protein [Solirubrobacterales bacterium]|nr:DUF1345 domain-containing protein [Solirubrobacterales bacterium]
MSTSSEPHWPPLATLAAAIALETLLPDRLALGPYWLLPALEAVLGVLLVVASPFRISAPHAARRRLSVLVAAVVSIDNGISLGLLCHLLFHRNVTNGQELIVSGALIWLTNVLVFSLWYWELDRGGPGARAAGADQAPDFLYPQMTDGVPSDAAWRPQFMDYLYLSLTNATAFSPTDVMPLSRAAKGVMSLQSLISLVTMGLVISRAVNIL